MDAWAYDVVDNSQKGGNGEPGTGNRKPGDTCGRKLRREQELRVRNDRHWSFVIGYLQRQRRSCQNGRSARRAVTSQPFRLNGHTGQARWPYDSFNSCAGGGQNRGDATAAHSAGGLVRRALLERPTAGDRGAGNSEPGTGNGRESGFGIRDSASGIRGSWLAARGPWRATAFACSRRRSARVPQARLKVATRREPVETGATDSPSFVSPSPGRGA